MIKDISSPDQLIRNDTTSGDFATMRVNVHVSEAEHLKLKMHAARSKTTIKELIRAYIASLPD